MPANGYKRGMIGYATSHMRNTVDGQGICPLHTSGNDIRLGLLMRKTEIECAAAQVIKSYRIQSSQDQETGLNI